jgi:hypothetical protein
MTVVEFARDLDDAAAILLPTLRIVPSVPYRRDQEPFWLQFKDMADRLIAAAASAEGSVLSWHGTDAQLGPAHS